MLFFVCFTVLISIPSQQINSRSHILYYALGARIFTLRYSFVDASLCVGNYICIFTYVSIIYIWLRHCICYHPHIVCITKNSCRKRVGG